MEDERVTDDIRHTLCHKTKRYRTTLWLVHNLISNIVPKKMGVPLVWRLKLAHYVPKIGKSNKKRSRHYLTPEMVPGKIR